MPETSYKQSAGLFGWAKGCTISNLRVKTVESYGGVKANLQDDSGYATSAGILVAYMESGVLFNC